MAKWRLGAHCGAAGCAPGNWPFGAIFISLTVEIIFLAANPGNWGLAKALLPPRGLGDVVGTVPLPTMWTKNGRRAVLGPCGGQGGGWQIRARPPRAQGLNGLNNLGTAKPGHGRHLGGVGMAAIGAFVKAKKRFWAGQNLPPPSCPPHGPKTAPRPFLAHMVGKGAVPTTSPSPPGGT